MWMPIETAPKDERQPILVYSPGHGFWGGGAFTVAYWCGGWAAGEWFTWPDAEYAVKPTHWMPLPDPPAE